MKKKILSMLLALALMISMIPGNIAVAADAGESTAVLTVGEPWANPGGTVDVELVITENPGVLGATIVVSWDESLTLVADASGTAFSHMTYTAPSRYTPSGTNFVWFGNEVGEAVDGTVLTLTFQVPETAENNEILPIWVTYTPGDVIDGDDRDVTLSITDGYVRVITYKPGDVTGDGRVNARDLVRLSQYISDGCKTDPEGYNAEVVADACDVTQDGRVNARDLIKLSQYISDGSQTNPEGYNAVLKPAKLPECEHTNMQATEAKAATCTEAGNIAYWYCDECAKYFSDADATTQITYADTILTATGHTEVIDEAVAPSYTETGLTEGSHCSVCNEVIIAQQIVPVLQATYHAIIYRNLQGAESPAITQFAEHEGLAFEDVPDPVRLGYTFLGWYTASEGGTKVDGIEPGTTTDVTVYAHWVATSYNIIYNKAGVNSNKTTYTIEEEVILADPEWSGLKFTGWSEPTGRLEIYENQAGETVARIPKGTTGDIEITANWTTFENYVNPKEDGKLASVFDPETGKYYFLYDLGMIENVPLDQIFETYEKTTTGNYTMSISETVTVESSKAQSIAQTMANSVTKPQQWQDTVGKLNEGTFEESVNLSIGMEAGVEKICQAKFQTDFGFSASFTAQSTSETTVGNVVDESTGLEKEYVSTITYAETLSTTSETSMEIPGSMPNGTYAFVHAGDVRVFALITYDPVEDWYYINTYSVLDNMHTIMLYYADKETMYDSPCGGLTVEVPVDEIKATVESGYYVQYNANGGEGTMPLSVFLSGETGTLSDNKFTKLGYTFDYWEFIKPDGTTDAYLDQSQVRDLASGGEMVELLAHWDPNTYTVIYKSDTATDGSSTAPSEHTYDEEKALTANGFVRQYTVTYNYNGSGAASTTATAKYSFAGWLAEDGTVYGDKATVLNLKSEDGATTTMTAQWTSASVTLPDPTRTGYKFAGWYSDANCTQRIGAAGSQYTPDANITLYAKWDARSYTVTYNANGGSVTPSDIHTIKVYDSEYGELPDATWAYCDFAGWYNGSTRVTSETVVKTAADHTLTAHWTPYTTGYWHSGSRDQDVTHEGYEEYCNVQLNRTALARDGYTTLYIKMEINGDDTNSWHNDDPFMEIYDRNDNKILTKEFDSWPHDWDCRTYEFEISIDALRDDGTICFRYDNYNGNDKWILGTVQIWVTAK